MTITSVRNPLVRSVVGLHTAKGRRLAGQVLVEGPTVLNEAVDAGIRPALILTTDAERWSGVADRVEAVSDTVLAKAATTRSPQEPVAVLGRPRPHARRPGRLVAWGIADPGNLGTMVRTAAALDVDVAVGGPGSADPWSPKAIRAGAGAHFRTAVVEVDAFDDALAGRPGLALVVDGGAMPTAPTDGRWALVVGSEAHGLPVDVVERCRPTTLPMPGGTESLNAAVAASVALYALVVG
jgi:TrmH family RNA methyltransferase